MNIDKIKSILPILGVPSENEGIIWEPLHSKIGFSFPKIYIEFIENYGTGSINNFFWIINPFSTNSSLSLDQSFYFLEAYSNLKDDFPEYYTRDVKLFFPWGFTDNGDSIVWSIDDSDPDQWSVIIQSSDPSIEETTDMTTVDFIEAILNNTLESSILPQDFLESKKTFQSI